MAFRVRSRGITSQLRIAWRDDPCSSSLPVRKATGLLILSTRSWRIVRQYYHLYLAKSSSSAPRFTKWDAGALMLWADDHHWAKLSFELSPEKHPMMVTVVTRGVSD